MIEIRKAKNEMHYSGYCGYCSTEKEDTREMVKRDDRITCLQCGRTSTLKPVRKGSPYKYIERNWEV